MEVSKGFKQTELGTIPIDWEVKTLGEVGDVKMCRRIFNHETSPTGTVPFFKIGTFGKEPDAFISRELYSDYRKNFSFPKKGDILISAAGTIGRTVIYNGDDAYFQDSNIVWLDNSKSVVSNDFLYYTYQVVKYNTEGGTIQRLYNAILKAAKFACPPSTEQAAIATALSDTDALITSLEKLIAKKRNIKQGAMQELLKPKKGWEVKTIQELIDENIIIGHLDGNHGELYPRSHEFEENGVAYVGATDFKNGGIDFAKCKYLPIERAKAFKKGIAINGDILFAHNATVGPVALVKTTEKFIIISTTATYFRCDNVRLKNLYLFYALQSIDFVIQYQSVMLQSTRAQVPIGQQRKFKLSFPSLEEQVQIASILSEMDSEISVLESKLEKYRQIKSGMMQNLLTGKIRLV